MRVSVKPYCLGDSKKPILQGVHTYQEMIIINSKSRQLGNQVYPVLIFIWMFVLVSFGFRLSFGTIKRLMFSCGTNLTKQRWYLVKMWHFGGDLHLPALLLVACYAAPSSDPRETLERRARFEFLLCEMVDSCMLRRKNFRFTSPWIPIAFNYKLT